MTVAQRLTSIEIDNYASEPCRPVGIITADRLGTQEFDDGIAVTPLPSASEMYRVSVFVVDTSHLYLDDDIVQSVIERKETKLLYDDSGLIDRQPMLDAALTRDLHFAKHNGALNALVVSFVVGKWCPPTDVAISYGQVEVTDNYAYDRFGGMCRDRKQFIRYGRAAAQIMKHLNTAMYHDDEEIYKRLLDVPRTEAEQRGININKAFMIAANYLTARAFCADGRPVIYRTNYFRDLLEARTLSQPIGRFSTTPGPHERLGLTMYARITSPLRRADDFINHGQLFWRELGKQTSDRDIRLLNSAVTSLNEIQATIPTEAIAS